MSHSITKYLMISKYIYKLRKMLSALCGDFFTNPGPIKSRDFYELRKAIDEVNPRNFIEIGTGTGVSTRAIYGYLNENYPQCHFYTLEINKRFYNRVRKEFEEYDTFHPVFGLSVKKNETTEPARSEIALYFGPSNTLRVVLNSNISNGDIDIAFIDSRIGTSLAEFLILKDHLSSRGYIFCHDAREGGKGMEVLRYLKEHTEEFAYEILDTGYEMLKIKKLE